MLPPIPEQAARALRHLLASLAPLPLDWRALYRARLELDRRRVAGRPRATQLLGHADSIGFDSTRIVTGSCDRMIKVWALQSGEPLATFWGHSGSVCQVRQGLHTTRNFSQDLYATRAAVVVSFLTYSVACFFRFFSLLFFLLISLVFR